jgi:hypothetical protein
MQLINLVSPFTFGVNSLDLGQIKYNFALRHYLTSFGTDLAVYNYFSYRKINIIFTTHFYKNYYKTWPGFEFSLVDIELFKGRLLLNSDTHVFYQPSGLLFFSGMPDFGYSLSTDIDLKIWPHWYLKIGLMTKTKGWVPGIVEQDKANSIYAGLRMNF